MSKGPHYFLTQCKNCNIDIKLFGPTPKPQKDISVKDNLITSDKCLPLRHLPRGKTIISNIYLSDPYFMMAHALCVRWSFCIPMDNISFSNWNTIKLLSKRTLI